MSSCDLSLRLRCAEAQAEIYVVDGAFHLVAEGLGEVSRLLRAGLYRVKVRVGGTLLDLFLILRPTDSRITGAPGAALVQDATGVTVTLPPLPFLTAAPLPDTLGTTDAHRDAARQHSRQVHRHLGSGSQLLLFARDIPLPTPPADGGPPHPIGRMSLHAASGELLLDFADAVVLGVAGAEPWAACNVALDPGSYLLRFSSPHSGTLQGVVSTARGWQTQMFCLFRGGEGRSGAAADHHLFVAACLSVFLAPLAAGFDPAAPHLRQTELLRLGLAHRRKVLPREALEQQRWVAARDPMAAIYGGYLLLRDRARPLDENLALLRATVAALRQALGPAHPEVEALALALDEPQTIPLPVPPMLLAGWAQILRRSLELPTLVPRGSLSARVAERLLGEGPWVVWDEAPAATALPQALAAYPDDGLGDAALAELVARFAVPVATIYDAWQGVLARRSHG